jgi:NTP pyrophosphatase (non-canonical NTP hydrolase)
MDFKDIQKRGLEIREAYNKLNDKDGHKQWGSPEYAQGLVGDVGDLVKLIMAKNNFRYRDNVDQKLAHELSDCLWAIIVLSKEFDIDLETEFLHTMNDLEEKIKEKSKQ